MKSPLLYISQTRRGLLAVIIVSAVLLTIEPESAFGQGLAQVNLAGIPPVLSSPALSDVAMQLDQGRFPMTFVFNSPDRQRSEFSFRVVLEREGEVVLDITSEVVEFTRGVYTYTSLDADPPISFPVGYHQIVDALGAGLDQDLTRTGLLSEGVYTLTVEAIPADPNNLVIAVPGSAMFSVQYLEPPVLLGPASDEIVIDRLPVFSWLPVVGGPPSTVLDYDFLLVEIYPDQEPTQAIEANRPIEESVLTGVTTLPYTADLLPLEAGKRYAWQVTARDAAGLVPFVDGGRSEISTFVYATGEPALATWTYPYSDPAIVFNLADAEFISGAYRARGTVEGYAGSTPVSALFDEVLLDPSTLDIISGRVVLLGEMAEGVGVVESDAAQHFLVDDTGPTEPFVSTRVGTGSTGPRLDVILGPSEDPESGVRSVSYRLVAEGAGPVPDEPVMFWNSVFQADEATARFPGGSYALDLGAGSAELLREDRLQLEIRMINGLGLMTELSSRVGTATDVSPPVVIEPEITYNGYYHLERPNTVEVPDFQVTDAESDIRSVEYRIIDEDGQAGDWVIVGEPNARSYRTGTTLIQLPPVDSDRQVRVEFRVSNAARLRTVWSEQIDIDVDETEPVLVGSLARFEMSESDPRIEIARDAVADFQSGIRELSYRVVDDRQPTRTYVDWTPFPPGRVAEVKRTQLNFTTSRAVRVEVRAENGARLASTAAEVIQVPELAIGDRTPPQVPTVSLRSSGSAMQDNLLLELRIGPSSDPETGISRVQYRIEDVATGSDLTGWVDVSGVVRDEFGGAAETIPLRVAQGVESLRAVVRVVNGAGGSSTASGQVAVATQDTTPPVIRSIQVYAQAGRVLAFIDGLEDMQSTISRVDYRILATDGTPLTEWTVYPIVPAGRSSYGRQLLRADVPASAVGRAEVIFRLRATNGSGLETVMEETVALER